MTVFFVGGGTLGSVTPLLAVAEELGDIRDRSGGLQASTHGDLKVAATFWGTRHGPERALVEAAGIPFRAIPAGKFRRYWDVRNVLDIFVIVWAFVVAFIRFLRWRPGVVVGAGSFVQVPVMWAAALLRIPIVIHQMDVRPSLANRFVAPFARAITVTFPESAKSFRNATVVGAPVRAAILAARDRDPREAKCHFGFSGDRPVLLILGGGTGAQFLNELVWAALPSLTSHADVIHVTGKGKFQIPDSRFQIPDSRYRPFDLLTDDLPSAYAAADLVVARAGMGTIAELLALQKCMALVPMPATHQEENAAAVAETDAADVWHERELNAAAFTDRVREFLTDQRHRQASARLRATLITPDAAERLAIIITKLRTRR